MGVRRKRSQSQTSVGIPARHSLARGRSDNASRTIILNFDQTWISVLALPTLECTVAPRTSRELSSRSELLLRLGFNFAKSASSFRLTYNSGRASASLCVRYHYALLPQCSVGVLLDSHLNGFLEERLDTIAKSLLIHSRFLRQRLWSLSPTFR